MSDEHFVTLSKKKIPEGEAKPFEIKIRGKIVKGLVLNRGGQFFAYHNLCKHLPITLDLNDGKFFTHDQRHLQCHMHGAMYEPETGFCTAGPCQGARLDAFDVIDEGKNIHIRVPEAILKG